MANTVYQKVRDLPPAIQRVLRSVNYGRTDIGIEAHETVCRSYGSADGCRAFVAIVDLATGQETIEWGSWGGPNMFNPQNAVDLDRADYPIPPNVVVVHGHIGMKTYATLSVRPDALVKWLPPAPELTARDRWVLWTFKGLTSAGRRNEWERQGSTPSETELDALAARGLLKRAKNGATQITTEGRNALGHDAGQSVPFAKE